MRIIKLNSHGLVIRTARALESKRPKYLHVRHLKRIECTLKTLKCSTFDNANLNHIRCKIEYHILHSMVKLNFKKPTDPLQGYKFDVFIRSLQIFCLFKY